MPNNRRKALTDWLGGRRNEMVALLEAAVNIDSGSHDKAGVDRVGGLFRAHLAGAGIGTRRYPLPEHGDCIMAEVPGSRGHDTAHVLLLGHMDTVFPAGTVAKRPFRLDGDVARGPGVADMKAGLVMNAFSRRTRFLRHRKQLVAVDVADANLEQRAGERVHPGLGRRVCGPARHRLVRGR